MSAKRAALVLAEPDDESSTAFVCVSATLSEQLGALWVANRCREVLAAFLYLEPSNRTALAQWLVQQYAPLTVRPIERMVDLPDEDVCAAWPLDVIVGGAQCALVRLLDEPVLFDEAVATALLRGQVRFVGAAWAPVDRRRQTLVERVTSLVAVMYLNADEERIDMRMSPSSERPTILQSGTVPKPSGPRRY
jgi:hypothetical protein